MMLGLLFDDMVAGARKRLVNTIILPNINKSPVALWHLQTFGSLGREDSVMKVQTLEVVTYFADILYWLMKASLCALQTCNIFDIHIGHRDMLCPFDHCLALFSHSVQECITLLCFTWKCLIKFVTYFVSYSQSSHMKLAPSWVAFT